MPNDTRVCLNAVADRRQVTQHRFVSVRSGIATCDMLAARRAIMTRCNTIGNTMQFPDGTKAGLYGAVAGAVVVAVVGFTLLGWTTAGTAQRNADAATSTALLAAMTPYCVATSNDPASAATLAEIKSTNSFSAQRDLIEKAGWATPMGGTEPNRSVTDACLRAITAKI